MATAEEILRAIAQKTTRGHYKLTVHAEQESGDEQITATEIEEALRAPELLEDYPDDTRGHSCLVLGFTGAGDPLHAVAGQLLGTERLVIITVYRPNPVRWVDWRKRR